MKKENIINNYFQRDKLIESMAHYELFYQIALGEYINDTSQNPEDVALKIETLGLHIEPVHVLNTMKQIIQNFFKEKEFDEIYNDNLRVNALIHALKDFKKASDDFEEKEEFYKSYYEKIMEDQFYNVKMHIHFENELKDRLAYWENLICDKTALELKESVKELIK